MSEPIVPHPTGIAPSADTTTAIPQTEVITAVPETVKPVGSTEVTNTPVTNEAAPESSEKTQPVPALTAPAEKMTETAPVEATTIPNPAAPNPATTEEPAKVLEEVEAPAATTTAPVISSGLSWPALDKSHPLVQFQARLPELLKTAEYNHIWDITLSAEEPIPFHTTLVLQKFLRANCNNVEDAYTQLLETLRWRRAYNPVAACEEEFSEMKFGGLGYVMKTQTKDGEKIVTYNIYGACKEPKKTFGDLNSFLRWRIALMEMGVKALDLPNATVPIPDYNATSPGSAIDPYQMIQLHDYQNVSFLRMDSATKAASREAIQVMGRYYPELLSIKYFVNVPVVMSWVFTAMKTILSKETVRKFRMISSGKGLASDLGSDEIPKAYGGKGADLAEVGLRPKLFKDTPPPSEKEKKPSKKSSMASLDKVRGKVVETITAVTETKDSATAPAPTVETIPEAKDEEAAAEKVDAPPTVPVKDDAPGAYSEAPNVPAQEEVSPIVPVKDDAPGVYSEAPNVPAQEEVSLMSEAPATPAKDVSPTGAEEAAPEVPAKDEPSSPAEVAVSNTVVEGSTTVEEPVSSVSGATASTEGSAEPEPERVAVEEPQAEKEESAANESLPVAPASADESVDGKEGGNEPDATAEQSGPAAEAETFA